MTAPVTFVSLYDQRVKLVQSAMQAHSKLGDMASLKLARHVLEALDHMPENVR
jgi:hypothetical protein